MNLNKTKRQTHFVAGFNFQGKRVSNVGEDLLSVQTEFLENEEGEDDNLLDGSPVQFDGSLQEVKLCEEGEEPDAIMFSRVSNELSDFEWTQTDILRDEVLPGDPATVVLYKRHGIIRTRLIDLAGLVVEDIVQVADYSAGDEVVYEIAQSEETDTEEMSQNDTFTLSESPIEGTVTARNADEDVDLTYGEDFEVDYEDDEFTLLADYTDDDIEVTYSYRLDASAVDEIFGEVIEIEEDEGFATILLK